MRHHRACRATARDLPSTICLTVVAVTRNGRIPVPSSGATSASVSKDVYCWPEGSSAVHSVRRTRCRAVPSGSARRGRAGLLAVGARVVHTHRHRVADLTGAPIRTASRPVSGGREFGRGRRFRRAATRRGQLDCPPEHGEYLLNSAAGHAQGAVVDDRDRAHLLRRHAEARHAQHRPDAEAARVDTHSEGHGRRQQCNQQQRDGREDRRDSVGDRRPPIRSPL